MITSVECSGVTLNIDFSFLRSSFCREPHTLSRLVLSLCALKHAIPNGTCGLVAMTSASHAEGRQFDPGQVYSLYADGQH